VQVEVCSCCFLAWVKIQAQSPPLPSESAQAAARVVGGGTEVADPALVDGAAWTAAEVLADPDQGEGICGVAERETGACAQATEDPALAAEAKRWTASGCARRPRAAARGSVAPYSPVT
jgi:hypothetical protein